jgi:hypothetical protein
MTKQENTRQDNIGQTRQYKTTRHKAREDIARQDTLDNRKTRQHNTRLEEKTSRAGQLKKVTQNRLVVLGRH